MRMSSGDAQDTQRSWRKTSIEAPSCCIFSMCNRPVVFFVESDIAKPLALRTSMLHSRNVHATFHLDSNSLTPPNMPRIQTAERALALLSTSTTSSSAQYICRTCRQHALRRGLHTTTPLRAEESFLSRIKKSVFGSKESKEAEKRRADARQKQVKGLAEQNYEDRQIEVIRDGAGRKYEVAALVDESLDKDYTPATTVQGLKWIGGERWVRQRADQGEQYRGYVGDRGFAGVERRC